MIPSSKFASPSRSLGREFNLISLPVPSLAAEAARSQQERAVFAAMQPRVAALPHAGRGCGRLGARTPLSIPALHPSAPSVRSRGPHLAESPAAFQGTRLPMHRRPRRHFVGFSTNLMCLCCFEEFQSSVVLVPE